MGAQMVGWAAERSSQLLVELSSLLVHTAQYDASKGRQRQCRCCVCCGHTRHLHLNVKHEARTQMQSTD